MRRTALLVATSLCLVPPLAADDWTAEQREALDHVQACYDAWERAVAERNHDIWVQACRPDAGLIWWFQGEGMPQDLDAYQRLTKWELETEKRVIFTDFRPIAVRIHGEIAVLAFYGYSGWIDTDGRRHFTQDQRLSVLKKKPEGWSLLAEMAMDVADAPEWIAQATRE